MKKLIITLLAFSGIAFAQTATPSAQTAPISISGKWTVHSAIGGQENDQVCTFVQTGTTLSGSCATDDPGKDMKFSGTIDGNKVSWTANSDYNGTALTIKFTGTYANDKIDGDETVDPFGVDGTFTATRVKQS